MSLLESGMGGQGEGELEGRWYYIEEGCVFEGADDCEAVYHGQTGVTG